MPVAKMPGAARHDTASMADDDFEHRLAMLPSKNVYMAERRKEQAEEVFVFVVALVSLIGAGVLVAHGVAIGWL